MRWKLTLCFPEDDEQKLKEHTVITDRTVCGTARKALAFIIAGAVFGDDGLAGYGLVGIGVILAVIDTMSKPKKK